MEWNPAYRLNKPPVSALEDNQLLMRGNLLARDWDLLAVYYGAIDLCCHQAMEYRPPKMPIVTQEEVDLYGGIVDAGARLAEEDRPVQSLLDGLRNTLRRNRDQQRDEQVSER